jgi:hypothetical protein
LPRHVVTPDVPEADWVCACGAEKRVIGEDVSEKLEYVPASFHVIQTRRIRGYLQADAYSGYDGLFRHGRVIEVACWTHARRRFREALETDPRAALMLALIQELYRVESEAEELPAERRKALRQERAVAILTRIDELRLKLETDALPKSPARRSPALPGQPVEGAAPLSRGRPDRHRQQRRRKPAASSPSAARTGSSPAAWPARSGRPHCSRWCRAAASPASIPSSTSATYSCGCPPTHIG